MDRQQTGTEVFNALFGGYEPGIITTVFGPAGSGKTNTAVLASIATARQGKKVVYVDTEGGFSVERFKQLSDSKLMDKILFLRPTTYAEQKKALTKLKHLHESIGLVVVDSITMLYRLELGTENVFDTNRTLGKQLADLIGLATKRQIPVLLTSQVYSAFDDRDKVCMVGGDLLRYGSKCLIELQVTPSGRRAILRKHRSFPEKEALFQITETGIQAAKEKLFRLF